MALNHRTRLAVAAAASAGALFAALFVAGIAILKDAEMKAGQDELIPALNEVEDAVKANSVTPNLTEVAKANPQISIAVFDSGGHTITRLGSVDLVSTKFDGLMQIGDHPVLLESRDLNGDSIVVGLDWSRHIASTERVELFASALWLPLVAAVGFATWLAAKATFGPLERLAKEAEAFSVESLSSRLEIRDVGEYREFVQRLNRFLEKLEHSVRREERFLADAAHELRTPLTVLRGHIETTLMRSRTPEEYRATLRTLFQETERMANLVELLLHSALPTLERLEGMDLAEAAERAHARWVDRFADAGVTLELHSEPAKVNAPEAEIDVVLDNLMSNGLRASPTGTLCSINVKKSGSSARISVTDEGTGIPSEHATRIFERFARVDTGRSRRDGGFGIGLSLCKRIVDSSGGHIWVEPNDGKGSTFIVELPSSLG